jgi:hypothetical protein
MAMQWDHYEYRIGEHYLSALINGDESGMSDTESEEFNAWRIEAEINAEQSGFTVGHWCDVEDSREDWGRCYVSGLFAMRCTVQLMVYK